MCVYFFVLDLFFSLLAYCKFFSKQNTFSHKLGHFWITWHDSLLCQTQSQRDIECVCLPPPLSIDTVSTSLYQLIYVSIYPSIYLFNPDIYLQADESGPKKRQCFDTIKRLTDPDLHLLSWTTSLTIATSYHFHSLYSNDDIIMIRFKRNRNKRGRKENHFIEGNPDLDILKIPELVKEMYLNYKIALFCANTICLVFVQIIPAGVPSYRIYM